MAKKKKSEEINDDAAKEKVEQIVTEAEEATEAFEDSDTDGARIEVARQENEDGKWEYFWLLYAKNGKPIATSPGPHKRLNDMKKAIESVVETIEKAPIIRLY